MRGNDHLGDLGIDMLLLLAVVMTMIDDDHDDDDDDDDDDDNLKEVGFILFTIWTSGELL
jgi:hypothetical protein